VPTSLAGSIVDEPTTSCSNLADPDRQSPNSSSGQARWAWWIGVSIGIVLSILYALAR
jgi:hypothetical protein